MISHKQWLWFSLRRQNLCRCCGRLLPVPCGFVYEYVRHLRYSTPGSNEPQPHNGSSLYTTSIRLQLYNRWRSPYNRWWENQKKNISNTADILQSMYGQENYPQEVSIIVDIINNETLHDIWIEIEPDMTGEVSIEENFVLGWQ